MFLNRDMSCLRNLKKELGTQCHGRRFRVWRWEQAVAHCIGDDWTEKAKSNSGWRAKVTVMIGWRKTRDGGSELRYNGMTFTLVGAWVSSGSCWLLAWLFLGRVYERNVERRVAHADASTQTPVTAPVVDAPSVVVERAPPTPVAVFVAPVPAVSCAAPTPKVEFRAPAPAASCAALTPEVEFVAPTPADSCAAVAPVAEYVTQAPCEPDEAPPPVVGRPGSVRRRHVVKVPPVVDIAGFVSAGSSSCS